MKVNKEDKDKAKEQRAEQLRIEKENEKRKNYFEVLSQDVRFKKYVLEEIIGKEIEFNETLTDNLDMLVNSSPDAVKSMLMAKAGALKTSKNIKKKILSNF